MKKKLISLLTAAAIMLAALPAAAENTDTEAEESLATEEVMPEAQAESEEETEADAEAETEFEAEADESASVNLLTETTASGTCGDDLTWVLDDEGILTISGSGEMTSYSSSSDVPWYSYRTSIISAEIEDNVTSVGKCAFYSCTVLTSVTIPSSVTSIGSDAFYNCSALENVYFTGDLEAWCNIVFGERTANPMCYADNLYINDILTTEISIPDSITEIKDYAFYGCNGLINVDIHDRVTSVGASAFYGCSRVTSVTIGDSVTSIEDYAFANSVQLENVYYTGSLETWCNIVFGNSTANPMCYADNLYINDVQMTEIVIPDSIMEIKAYTFYRCSDLTSVTMSENVTSIGESAFYGCSGLTSVTIPGNVTSIGNSAFHGCNALNEVNYGGGEEDWSAVSVGSGNECLVAICGVSGICGSDLTWTLKNRILTISGSGDMLNYYNSNSIPWYNYHTNIISAEIEDNVTSVGQFAFYSCTSLTSVTIPGSVTSIGNSAFYGCSALTTVNYGGSEEDWSAVSIGSGNENLVAAYGVSGICGDDLTWTLKNRILTVSGSGDMTSYSSYKNVPWHSYNTNIVSIAIGDGVTSIGDYAFYGCTDLTSVTIGSGVTSIGDYAFYNCSSLTYVYYNDSFSSFAKISISSENTPLTNAKLHCSDISLDNWGNAEIQLYIILMK